MSRRRAGLVGLIGAFKLVKASLLVALGLTGLLGISHEAGRTAERAAGWAGLFPGHAQVHRAFHKLTTVDGATAVKFGVAALVYAAVFAVEGVGLLLGKRWAEWMTVGVTGSFVPIEIYELVAHFTGGKVVALVLNVAIVLYLVARRLEERRRSPARLRRIAGVA